MIGQKSTFVVFFLVLCLSATKGKTDKNATKTWSCPYGWSAFATKGPLNCIWISSSTANSFQNAHDICDAFGSNLVSVFSEEKSTFVHNRILKKGASSIWTALKKDYGRTPTWRTVHGEVAMTYKPDNYQPSSYYSHRSRSTRCGIVDSDGSWYNRDCSSTNRHFICEKHPECAAGWWGKRCENQCHCYDHSCDPTSFEVTCPYGCEKGWMGDACDRKREKASLNYHCVNSDHDDRHVSIEIDTKGIFYRSIQAMEDTKTAIQWCNDTELTHQDTLNRVDIKIRLTDNSTDEMSHGLCAGKKVGNGTYDWNIAIQEWEGLFMPNDQILIVRCNFTDAETLDRKTETIVTGKTDLESTKHKEMKEKVVLELADAATNKKLHSSSVGSPVVLQIRYGLNEGSSVKSVSPYNCEASSADGTQRMWLLDSDGCKADGSPVEPFAETNSTNTIATPWFPYFSFEGTSHVTLHCSFVFCYDTSCHVGCGSRESWQRRSRHVRSTNDGLSGYLQEKVGVA